MTLRLSKKGLINICLSCIMFIYFLFGILVSFNSLNLSERLDNKLALALVLLLVLWMFLHGRTEKVNVGYHVLFVLLSLCVMVSALLNLSLSLLEYTFCGLFISIVWRYVNYVCDRPCLLLQTDRNRSCGSRTSYI